MPGVQPQSPSPVVELGQDARKHLLDVTGAEIAAFERFADLLPIGILLAGPDGHCRYSNPWLQRLTGRQDNALAGSGWFGCIHPDDRTHVVANWQATVAGHEFCREFRVLTADGDAIWVQGQAVAYHDDQGRVLGVVCTLTDVSQRRRARLALAQSERRLSSAQRLAQIGDWERDLTTDAIQWSDQVYAIFGISRNSGPMTFPRVLEMIHPDDRVAVAGSVERAITGGDMVSQFIRIIRPDGEVRTIRQLAEVVRGENGRPRRFFGTVQDITDYRRAMDALQRSEERFRTMFAAGGTGMVVTDMAGRYVMVNPAFCHLVGYAEAELQQFSSRDLTHPDERDSHDRYYEALFTNEIDVHTREKRYIRKGGSTVWVIITASVFRDSVDGKSYLISNFQDITERKLAEQALARSEAILLDAQKLANVGNWERDLATSRITWSDQLYDIFGIERSTFDGRFETLLEMVHPEDRHILINRQAVTDVSRDAGGESFRIVRPDGVVRYARTERRILTDAEGRPVRAIGILQDVTELRTARTALSASEARFRGVFEAGGAGIVVVDEDGRFQQINQAFADFVGYESDVLAGMSIFDVVRVSDHDVLRRNRDRLFAGDLTRVSAEHRFAHRDGAVRWATVSATAMIIPPDERPLLILTVQDITQRRLADEELARKTALIDMVHELALAANKATDFEALVGLCLNRICSVTGWSVGHAFRAVDGQGGLEDMATWYLSDPERYAPFCEVTGRIPAGEGNGMPRAVLQHGDVEWRKQIQVKEEDDVSVRGLVARRLGLVSGFAAPVMAGDDIIAVLEFFSDEPIAQDDQLIESVQQIGTELGRVYERQRAETALRRREEQLSKIVDNAPMWIFVKDRNGRYLLANKAAAGAYGLSPEEIVGRTQDELYPHPEALANIRAGDLAVIESGVTRLYPDATFHASDGEIRNLRIVKVPFTTQDGTRAVLGLAADVTDEKRTEAQLRRAMRMDALGQMTGGVAHDFNNLLTIILGNLQLLERRLTDPSNLSLTRTAERASRRAAEVTGRLLAFARSQPLEPRSIAVNMMIDDMLALMERTIGVGIEMERELEPELWLTMADPAQLENALINLVVNARDAMPEGGMLTLSTANVRLQKSSSVRREIGVVPGDYVCIAVQDSGTGMSDDVAARALEPFFTTKEVGRGSGLGLSTIYGFARQSGGAVQIQTSEGKGTKVSIFLPRCASPTRLQGDVPQADARGDREVVLVVEDDPDIRFFAAHALEHLNYSVIEAGDTDAARRILLNGEGVDVLFTDVVVAGPTDGRALAVEARRLRPGIGIILTSGNWDLTGGRPTAEQLPHVKTLQKPYTEYELAVSMVSVLRSAFPQEVPT